MSIKERLDQLEHKFLMAKRTTRFMDTHTAYEEIRAFKNDILNEIANGIGEIDMPTLLRAAADRLEKK